MTRLFYIMLTLLFSLSGPALGRYSDFGCWSIAANSAPALSLADDVATLKSIRRYSERLVLGKVTSSNASTMLEARDIQAAIANGNYRGAGTGFHSLNFKMARDAQSRGFLPNLKIDQSLATPGGFLPSRRPDYLFGGAGFTTSNPSAQVREPTATPVNS